MSLNQYLGDPFFHFVYKNGLNVQSLNVCMVIYHWEPAVHFFPLLSPPQP